MHRLLDLLPRIVPTIATDMNLLPPLETLQPFELRDYQQLAQALLRLRRR